MGKIWVGRTNGCWVEAWASPRYQGEKVRVYGPIDLPYVRVSEGEWGDQVASLLVGPNAYVQGYEDLNFHDSVFWLLPNQRVDDVADLRCNDEIDSLRLWDRPPFAHEPGYSAYMLWAASHMARLA